jgi:RNA polymerase sigma-70 factor (TIGR02957 family)
VPPAEREMLLERLRPRAFAIAYRMLGSATEAEDVVQESLLRLHRELEAGEEIASPAAYVATIATRLSIDELRSARARRERYVGEWLPEPLLAVDDDDPARRAELSDTLSLAFLRVLERLTPEQRAVFLLREVFDYPYAEIAEVLGRSEQAARQLAVRARRQVEAGRPRFTPSREEGQELAERFVAAVNDGDVKELESLLAADVELHGDGGGKVPALARPLHGRDRAARVLGNWARVGARMVGARIEPCEVNGGPGAVFRDANGRLAGVMEIEVGDREILSVNSVVNPDKLAHLGPVANLGELLAAARR